MLFPSQILRLDTALRLASLATIAGLLSTSLAQTSSTCNPTAGQTCPADPALGGALTIDFTSGASSAFTSSGSPTYDSTGAHFTVAKSGDAPTITSKFYIMFGKYSITMKAAPGQGIVSSAVLQSDDLDEIDWEWLGGRDSEVQSNYFSKGQSGTGRSAILPVSQAQEQFHTYTIEWTSTQIVWQIDGVTVEAVQASTAGSLYPQTPMQLKIGAWAGGDPTNPPGTIAWAGGQTNYANGPFTMTVKSVDVQDYSTGSSYSYSGTTGTWQSIKSNGGTINGGSSNVDTSAPQVTSTSSGQEPWDGTHRSSSSATTPNAGGWTVSTVSSSSSINTNLPGLPSGWTVSPSGKVVPLSSSATSSSPLPSSTQSPSPSQQVSCSDSGVETVTTFNQQGFLSTLIVPTGSKSFDNQGFPITAAPVCSTVYNIAGTTVYNIPASPVADSSTSGANVALAVQVDTSTVLVSSVASPSAGPTSTAAAARSDAQKNIASLVDSLVALVASFIVFLLIS